MIKSDNKFFVIQGHFKEKETAVYR